MTLVYAGKTEDRSPVDFNTLVKDTITCARLMGSFRLEVVSIEEFGEGDEAVDVLTFQPTPKLIAARSIVEYWNASQYKDYKPHATIGPAGSAVNNPMNESKYETMVAGDPAYSLSLYFTRIAACWGDKRLTFNLGSSDY